MKRYIRLWLLFARQRLLVTLAERWGALFFIAGKFVRFILIGLFILSVSNQVQLLQGYSQKQLIIVYLLFNFFDFTTQFLFRGIYSFRQVVLYGYFDRDLMRPVKPIFSALMTGIDFLDLPLWLVTTGGLVYYLAGYAGTELFVFGLLVFNGLLIITAIHILVASSTILFTTADHLIGVYRDFSAMARMPIDIYALPVRLVLNSILPIGVAFTLPANLLFGKQGGDFMVYGLAVGLIFYLFSLSLWSYSLTRYTSASS